MIDWLKARLTQAKQDSNMWQEFVEAVHDVFNKNVEPVISRLKGLSSISTHELKDLDILIAELGSLFDYESTIPEEDRALSVIYRMDEIHQKNSAYNINAALSREFGSISIEWQPLYAKKTGIYGEDFRTAKEIAENNLDINNWFMTSRGVLNANLSDIYLLGFTRAEFVRLLRKKVKFLVPTHGVYDGERLYLVYVLTSEAFTAIYNGTKRERVTGNAMKVSPEPKMGVQQRLRSHGKANYTTIQRENLIYWDDLPIDAFSIDATFTDFGETYN